MKRLLLAMFFVGTAGVQAEVRMPAIFGDHMVLQREIAVPVWGTAAPDEKIAVTLGSRTGSTVAGADGQWRVNLPSGPKNEAPQVLTVAGSANTLTFQDVLVGDVWIASGQSNMEFGLQTDSRGAEAIKTGNDPGMRLFFVPWASALEPWTDIKPGPHDPPLNGKWQVCTPDVLSANWAWHGFSAIGYYFAREVRRSTGAPVGVIETNKGGTPAQAWVSLDGLGKEPPFTRYLADHQALVGGYQNAVETLPKRQADFAAAMKQWNAENGQFQATLKQWDAAVQQANAAGQPPPPRPTLATKMPTAPTTADGGMNEPANLYHAMVAPLVPYAIRGVIWYQGESNGDRFADAVEYNTLFPRLITDWREKWGQGNFPFLYVQLANFKAVPKTPSEGIWPWLREAQLRTLALPNTGMAVSIDIGDPADIHPKDKLDVGLRLALAERHVAQGEDNLVWSGPIFDASKVEGNKIRLTLKQRGGGLLMGVPPWTPSGHPPETPTRLNGFGIAGADQNFVWADAVIDGESVVVSSAQVSQPVAVRYDWADSPQGNLYNKEGLPASPFRTDDWPAPAK